MSFFDFNSSKLTSFEPSEFYSDTFSVDEFIQRKRYSVPLDVLRDDLGLHLKSLRSSLIELINQDYGQFVSLSSNLVGLDGKIQNIAGPLTRAQSEIETLHQALQRTLDGLQGELDERRSIRATQSQLQLLRRVHACLDSSEKCLEKCPADIQTSADFVSLQVACDKVADTRRLIQRCLPSPLVNKLKKRCESCCEVVLKKLDVLIRAYGNRRAITKVPVESVEGGGDEPEDDQNVTVRSILSMYSQLQSEAQVESIFINDILKPKCDIVLARKGNIGALLSEIELFIHHSPILGVSRELEGFPWMRKYDFLTRGVFPHLVGILMKQFPHIWSPSTPDSFHSNWLRCSGFIDVIESALPSLDHLEEFRNSRILKEFTSKWQFNVYFQLRFHSLAIELESALESIHSGCPLPDFKLDATRVLVKVISQCWDSDKIFIVQLHGRFMKASALFISRYLKEIQAQVTSNSKVTLDQLILVSADLTLSELILRQILLDKIEGACSSISSKATDGDDATPRTEGNTDDAGAKFLSMFAWEETQAALEGRLIELTVGSSVAHVTSVNEVPRLFRRTNRDVPTKPSEYVNSILQPIQAIHHSMRNAKQGDLLERVGPKVGRQVLNRYKAQMDEVLTSVQRMEESLKRLKKVKGQNQIQPPNNGINETENPKMNNTPLSDDDKIRRQIELDFDYLTEQIRTIAFI